MYTETMPTEFSPALVPPCCSDCWAVMNLKSAEPWTLLRGYQLVKYTFECNICGGTVTSMKQEDR